jgi:hypothetical protein
MTKSAQDIDISQSRELPLPPMLFDLDGLVDSAYQHVLAWHEIVHLPKSVRNALVKKRRPSRKAQAALNIERRFDANRYLAGGV